MLRAGVRTGEPYVADAYLGLLRAPARGSLAVVVAAEAGGVPFNFLTGLVGWTSTRGPATSTSLTAAPDPRRMYIYNHILTYSTTVHSTRGC
jgi:hypothetical protein